SGSSHTRSCISHRGYGRISPWEISRKRSGSSPAASGASANCRRNVRRRRKAKGTVSEALRTRVLTAVVLAAVLLAVVLWLPAWATRAAVTAVVLAGAWEWSAFLRVPATSARGAYVLLVAALLAHAWRVTASPRRKLEPPRRRERLVSG